MVAVLVLIGLYGCLNGFDIEMSATTAFQQIVAYLSVGFGLISIGLGGVIHAINAGFAGLQKAAVATPAAIPPIERPAAEHAPHPIVTLNAPSPDNAALVNLDAITPITASAPRRSRWRARLGLP